MLLLIWFIVACTIKLRYTIYTVQVLADLHLDLVVEFFGWCVDVVNLFVTSLSLLYTLSCVPVVCHIQCHIDRMFLSHSVKIKLLLRSLWLISKLLNDVTPSTYETRVSSIVSHRAPGTQSCPCNIFEFWVRDLRHAFIWRVIGNRY